MVVLRRSSGARHASDTPSLTLFRVGQRADEGLDVEPVVVRDVAATTAAVISGEQHIGLSATVPLVQASSKDVPVRVVANAVSQRADMNALVVKPDSAIHR